MSKLLSIVGPTAVGKTEFAWQVVAELEQMFGQSCEVIAADSRQVYRGLEMLSGADVPPDARWEHDHWQVGVHRLWGVGIIAPNQEWSVAHFRQYANQICENAWRENRLPVIVGGTGLYSDLATSSDPRLDVKPDPAVREKAEQLTLDELQAWVKQAASLRWEQLNDSDRANPRRLVRALEQAGTVTESWAPSAVKRRENIDQLIIGLNTDLDTIVAKITNRVHLRWQHGAQGEVESLLSQADETSTWPALTATGVKQIRAYLAGALSVEQLLESWSTAERQYAKRQLTWWKKRDEVSWYQVDQPNWSVLACQQITAWYQAN